MLTQITHLKIAIIKYKVTKEESIHAVSALIIINIATT